VSESKRFGPVQVRFNEDGTLSIYQPDSNRALSPGLAWDLIQWLTTACPPRTLSFRPQAAQSTVGGGVISTSEGPVDALSGTEAEADSNALETSRQLDTAELVAQASIERGVADVEAGRVSPAKRKPGRPRKTS